jgi:Zn-dependent metalloprotease
MPIDIAVDELGVQREITHDGNNLNCSDLNIHTYRFNFQSYRNNLLPGEYVNNVQGEFAPAGVSAHANAIYVASFLKEVLEHEGLNKSGGKYISTVECIEGEQEEDGTNEWLNAAWIEYEDKQCEDRGQFIFGQIEDSNCSKLISFAASMSIVAHEFFHGVTYHMAGLKGCEKRLDDNGEPYFINTEPSSLNESYSDIFAVIITNYDNPDRNNWHWEIGWEIEDVLSSRNLSPRSLYSSGAGQYTDFVIDDRPHCNSGIHSKAAYRIMIEVDQGKYLLKTPELARLFYRSLLNLGPTAGFIDSRNSLIFAAASLFYKDSQRLLKIKSAISEAFDSVGIDQRSCSNLV